MSNNFLSVYKSTYLTLAVISGLWILLFAVPVSAQKEMPPAKVVTAKIKKQVITPESEFIGTVYYKEVSEVASEVEGIVEKVSFDDGQRVKKGQELVKLNSDLLEKELQATTASYEESLAEMESARLDVERIEGLYKKSFASAQEHDSQRYRLEGLQKKAQSIEAQVERIKVELDKKTIMAPFSGIVITKAVEPGEWLGAGSAVATLAQDDMLEVVAEIPERILPAIKPGQNIMVKIHGHELNGKVITIIPKGDMKTRTFPVKVSVPNTSSFIEGMEAVVNFPEDKKQEGLVVSRDAIVNRFGSTFIFIVAEGKARMLPVQVTGYAGLEAAVTGQGLQEGMDVVIKGNERLQDGQPVMY